MYCRERGSHAPGVHRTRYASFIKTTRVKKGRNRYQNKSREVVRNKEGTWR